jgi:hypothetical protein
MGEEAVVENWRDYSDFSCRDWVKPRKHSVGVACAKAEIRTGDIMNMNHNVTTWAILFSTIVNHHHHHHRHQYYQRTVSEMSVCTSRSKNSPLCSFGLLVSRVLARPARLLHCFLYPSVWTILVKRSKPTFPLGGMPAPQTRSMFNKGKRCANVCQICRR